MNRKDLEKQILINFENDELKEKEMLENIMQCVDAYADRNKDLVAMYRQKVFRLKNGCNNAINELKKGLK